MAKHEEERVFGKFEDYLKVAAEKLATTPTLIQGVVVKSSDVVMAAAAMYVGDRLEELIKLQKEGKGGKEK